jgi:nucleosome binding factor SPN SPT16 subunit
VLFIFSLGMLEARLRLLSAAWQAAATDFTTVVLVVGDFFEGQTDNLRSTAVIQFLFGLAQSPANVGVIISRSDSSLTGLTLSYCVGASSNVSVPAETALTDVKALQQDEFVLALKALADGSNRAAVRTCAKELPLQRGVFVSSVEPILATFEDSAPAIGTLLFVKDAAGVASIGKAGMLATALFKRYIQPTLEDIATRDDGKTSLASFSGMITERIANPATIPGLEKMEAPEDFSGGLPVYVTHAGEYTDKLTESTSSAAALAANALVIRFGVKYRGYTAYVSRTFLFEKSMPSTAPAAYELAVEVQGMVLEELVPGAHVAAIASKCLEFAKAKNALLASKMLPVLGWITGLNVTETKGQIGGKGTTVVQPDMAFVVRVVIQDLEDSEGRKFAVEVADTVVTASTGPAVFRTKAPRAPSDIMYSVADVNEGVDEEVEVVETRKDLRAITRAGQAPHDVISAEATRMERLAQLLVAKEAEWRQSGGKRVTAELIEEQRTYELGRLGMGEVACYPNGSEMPPTSDFPPTMLRIHRAKCAAWLPVAGRPVAFHIATINKVDVKKDGSGVTMIVSFHSTQESNHAFKQHRTKVFIRELTYTGSGRHEKDFEEFARQVREIQAQIKNADVARKAKQGLAAMSAIKLTGSPLRLRSVRMRPPPVPAGKNHRDVGNLELHENGLRFTFNGGETLEFPFDNVKHFIFQHAATGQAMTIFHITLKQPMMIGKRKLEEVQVVAEVLEAYDDLEKGRRGGDAGDEEQEERDRKLLIQTNLEFMNFSRAVEGKFGRSVETGIQKFSFSGVPQREMTVLRGSTRVLWAVTDFPFFTMSVSDIEMAHFERAMQGNKTFDVSFIPTSYKAAIPVTSIAWSDLGVVKDWCLSANLPYAEHAINVAWPQMLKVIREDKDWEPWDAEGGWRTCMEDDEDEEDDDDDSSYHESDDEDDDSDSDYSDEESSDLDWDESDSEPETESSGSEDDDEYWEKMDRKAKDEDTKRRLSDSDDSDDSEAAARRKKKQRRTEAPPPARGAAQPTAAPGVKRPQGAVAPPMGSSGMKSKLPMPGKSVPGRPVSGMPPPRPAPGMPPRR